MLDKSHIGHEFRSFSTEIEKGRLRFFAKATGQTDPIYNDEQTAKQAGYASLPAPPTYPFILDMEGPELLPVLTLLDMDIARILHGTQEFEYFTPMCAGDTITVTSHIRDIFDKKNGALEFVVLENNYTNQYGELAAKATNTIVYRTI